MDYVIAIGLIFIALIVYAGYAGAKARQALNEAINAIPGFAPTQQVIASTDSAVAVDERSGNVCFAQKTRGLTGISTYLCSYSDVLSCDIVEERTVHSPSADAKVSALYLKTLVRDTARPTHLTRFLTGVAISVDGRAHREMLAKAQHWHGLLTVIAREADKVSRLSPADELQKLASLKADGILTEDEWSRSKELYLGKPTAKREEAVDMIRDLHSLFERGALSESEFNTKKWEILARRDF